MKFNNYSYSFFYEEEVRNQCNMQSISNITLQLNMHNKLQTTTVTKFLSCFQEKVISTLNKINILVFSFCFIKYDFHLNRCINPFSLKIFTPGIEQND